MAALHTASVFNVRASLNAWLQSALAALDRPPWLASYTLVFNAPEASLSAPAFAVVHHFAGQRALWLGLNPGVQAEGVMEISAWASRGPSWQAQLNSMQAMIEQAAAGAASVAISDYQSAPAAPPPTLYKIDLLRLQALDAAPPASPDLARRAFALRYAWVLRV